MQYCRLIGYIILISVNFLGCALPVEGRQSSVPVSEIIINRLLELSEKQIAASRFADASLTLDQITYINPNLPSIDIGQVKAKLGLGLYEEAVSIARRLIEENPTDPKFKSLYAQSLAASGKRLEAIKIWRELATEARMLNKADEEADYLRNIAESLFIIGKDEESYCASEEAFNIRPASREEFLRFARIGFGAGKSKAVFNKYGVFTGMAGIPADPAFYLIRSYINFNSGSVEQALNSLRTAKEFQGAPIAVSSEIEFFDTLLRYRLFPETVEYWETLKQTLEAGRISSSQALFWPSKIVVETISIQNEVLNF